jgi:hypothetical protein
VNDDLKYILRPLLTGAVCGACMGIVFFVTINLLMVLVLNPTGIMDPTLWFTVFTRTWQVTGILSVTIGAGITCIFMLGVYFKEIQARVGIEVEEEEDEQEEKKESWAFLEAIPY